MWNIVGHQTKSEIKVLYCCNVVVLQPTVQNLKQSANIRTLLYYITVTSHFLSAPLTYKTQLTHPLINMLNTAKSASFYEASAVNVNTCPVTGEPMPCFSKTVQQLTMQTIHMYC